MGATQAHHRAVIGDVAGLRGFQQFGFGLSRGRREPICRPAELGKLLGIDAQLSQLGEAHERLGSITKQGSAIARFVLGQIVLHVLRRDGKLRRWYKQLKNRRGSKIARVAVMRRLTTIIWHMLRHNEPYRLAEPCPRRHADEPRDACVTAAPARTTSARARQKGAAPTAFTAASDLSTG